MKTKTEKTGSNGRVSRPKKIDIQAICKELQNLQRKRKVAIKSRIANANRLVAVVATDVVGYDVRGTKKEREAAFDKAQEIVKKVRNGEMDDPLDGIVHTGVIGIEAFEALELRYEKAMIGLAEKLPVASWCGPGNDQHGFGIKNLAVVIGETGDLSNYANPAKVWRRMGCAPFQNSEGKTLMGSTWRSGTQGKLHADEWSEYGYSKWRRSVAFNVGGPLIKQNGAVNGPYRARYDQVKEEAKEKHPDWTPLHIDRHANLLMTKMLLRNLWCVWNGKKPRD